MLFATFMLGIDEAFFDIRYLLMPRFSIPVYLFGLESEIAQHQMEHIFEINLLSLGYRTISVWNNIKKNKLYLHSYCAALAFK